MRLLVLSDLHTERAAFPPPEVDADVVVLAGDIGRGTEGVAWARGWADRPVLYLAGNHEYYGHDIPGLTGELRHAAAGSTVRVLENEELIIDGVRFLGCTLWSDFAFSGPERRAESMDICAAVVNDYKQIRFGPESRPLTPADTLALHEASREWLSKRLNASHDGPTVVLTHHVPLIRRRPEKRLMQAVAGAFASDLTALMGADRVDLWIYGHTHMAADTTQDGTRIVSNPRGYPNQSVDGWDPRRVVIV